MSTFQQEYVGHTEKQETQFEETEEVSKPLELNIIGMLELSDQEKKNYE